MTKNHLVVLNFEQIKHLCADHALGLSVQNPDLILENGSYLEIRLLSSRRIGSFLRSEIQTAEKTPRKGILRIFEGSARVEFLT